MQPTALLAASRKAQQHKGPNSNSCSWDRLGAPSLPCAADMGPDIADNIQAGLASLALGDPDNDKKAAELMDKLDNCADPAEQAALRQQVYELRLKSVAASVLSAGAEAAGSSVDDPAAVEKQQPSSQAAQRMASPTSSNSSSASSSADCWDASDDWEPDVSCLRSASSFERQREKTVVLQPFQSTPHPQRRASGSPPQPARLALSEPATSVRGSSGGGSSKPASSAGGSRLRGRGQSKCGLPTSDSEDEALLAAAANAPHIVEFHGLTRAVSTTHLETFLLDYMWGTTAANVKWVDDEHALAVFPCTEAAQALLESAQRDYKVRPYHKASRKALHVDPEELTPPRAARPKTTTAVARRLISNALGNSQVRDKAAEKELAALRKANKEGKKERAQQLEAAWGEDDE